MSLSPEQHEALQRLQAVFNRFDPERNPEALATDESGHASMMMEMLVHPADKAQLQKLSDMRRSMLKQNLQTPVQKLTDTGDFQLSFE